MKPPHKLVRAYEAAREALQGRDLAERCQAAGFRWDPRGVEIPFLGRRFQLSVDCLELRLLDAQGPEELPPAAEEQEHPLSDRILILHYLDHASGAALAGTPVGFDQLAGGRFYGGVFHGRVELRLARAFAAEPARLAEAARPLGGVPAGFGDTSVLLHPFPRVPLTIILWQGDEEVPANGKVLWDAGAESYLVTEDLVVLGERVADVLTAREQAAMKSPTEAGSGGTKVARGHPQ